MNTTYEKLIERALDHADKTTAHEPLSPAQRAERRDFGRDLLKPFVEVEQMMKGEIPWPSQRPTLKERIAGWKLMAEELDDEEN